MLHTLCSMPYACFNPHRVHVYGGGQANGGACGWFYHAHADDCDRWMASFLEMGDRDVHRRGDASVHVQPLCDGAGDGAFRRTAVPKRLQ